jgi:colanic acid biosynthesis glycosyl transferase WcaI
MKILIISQYFWPENFRINDLVGELVSRGHDVSVLTGKPNYPSGKVFNDFRRNPKGFERYSGATIYRAPMLARGTGALRLILNFLSFAIGASLYGALRLKGQQFDIVFVYEPSPVTVGLPGVLISRVKKIPMVFWVQDLWPETLVALNVVRSRAVLAAIESLVGFIYNRSALVLGQSHGFLGSIAKYCKESKRIRYFPNWAEDGYSLKETKTAPEVPTAPGVFTVLFAGNVGDAQDFPAILAAAEGLKSNPAIRWIIVGDGRKSEWLHQEVIARGLSHCVILLGRFPVERMSSFYKAADVLLVSLAKNPVFALTIPSKVQSYLMAGVPLLAMLDGEGAETILKAKAGLVCGAGDSEGLIRAVKDFLEMPLLERERLGSNGRNYALNEFGLQSLVDKLEGWFVSVTEAHRGQNNEVSID